MVISTQEALFIGGKMHGMLRKIVKMVTRLLLSTLALTFLILILPRLVTAWHSRRLFYTIKDSPTKPVAIVFGAGLWRDGSPTPVLRDRVATAAELYFAGKVQKLLLSGDNSYLDYNEPGAMHAYALELGVPEEALVLDYAGRRTYDTCYRARDIFGVREAILVTQTFHLPRALYTCAVLNIDVVGVASDRTVFLPVTLAYWNLRELPATLVALWEVHISRPLPILGKPEPIFFKEAQ